MPAPHAPNRSKRRGSGFTLIELIGVMVLVSILSVTAIPSLARLDRARDAAMISECERMIRFAQANAVSIGLPTGIRIDLDEQALRAVTIDPEAGDVIALRREVTGQAQVLSINSAYAGTRLEAFGFGGLLTTSGATTLWFDFDGSPQTRDDSGQNPAPLDEEFSLESAGGISLLVSPVTGRVHR